MFARFQVLGERRDHPPGAARAQHSATPERQVWTSIAENCVHPALAPPGKILTLRGVMAVKILDGPQSEPLASTGDADAHRQGYPRETPEGPSSLAQDCRWHAQGCQNRQRPSARGHVSSKPRTRRRVSTRSKRDPRSTIVQRFTPPSATSANSDASPPSRGIGRQSRPWPCGDRERGPTPVC